MASLISIAAAHGRGRRGAAFAALVTATVAFVLSALPIRPDHVGMVEQAAFRAVNDVSWVSVTPVWMVMQLGSLLAVPALAGVAALARRYRLAAQLAASGVLAYLLAPPVKAIMERGRPSALLADVVVRDASEGLGFVSGHTAVAVALAVAAVPFLGWRGRAVVLALAGAVAVARVYVGAHLPLDVVGGAALGVVLAVGVHLAADGIGVRVSPGRGRRATRRPVPPLFRRRERGRRGR
jgi:membrane-associated phospholipid phosphatase